MDAVMTVNKVRVEEKMKKKEGGAEKGLEAKKAVTAGDMKDTQEADQKAIAVKRAAKEREVLT